MASKSELERQSDKAATVALWFLIPVFLFVVTEGWQRLLSNFILIPTIPLVQDFLPYGLAFFIAAMGIVLAKGIAFERRRVAQNSKAVARFTWVAYFVVLVAISAFGTINMIFGVTETPTYIKNVARETEDSLSKLNQIVQTKIATSEYDGKRLENDVSNKKLEDRFADYVGKLELVKAQAEERAADQTKEIDDLIAKFRREVENPANPGLGVEARRILEMIEAKLPDLRLPSGEWKTGNTAVKLKTYLEAMNAAKTLQFSQLNCELSSEAQKLLAEIKDVISKINLIKNMPCDRVDAQIRSVRLDIDTFKASSSPQISTSEQTKVEIKNTSRRRLSGQVLSMKQLYSDVSKLNKETASPILKEAWLAYSDTYREVLPLISGGIPELDSSIEVDTVDKLGNILVTIQILVSRLDNPITYLIIIAGLLFDVILISFYGRHLSSIENKEDDFSHLPSIGVGGTYNLFNE